MYVFKWTWLVDGVFEERGRQSVAFQMSFVMIRRFMLKRVRIFFITPYQMYKNYNFKSTVCCHCGRISRSRSKFLGIVDLPCHMIVRSLAVHLFILSEHADVSDQWKREVKTEYLYMYVLHIKTRILKTLSERSFLFHDCLIRFTTGGAQRRWLNHVYMFFYDSKLHKHAIISTPHKKWFFFCGTQKSI